MKYGFLGLGIMGSAMARNLITAGLDVTVWNRDGAKCAPLVEAGAAPGESPAAVAAACDLTFAMLSDPAAAEAVCIGPSGVLEGIRQGSGYVDMSTIDPETSRSLAKAIAGKGARHLEAPVSGTKKPAEDGTLIILAAGALANPMFAGKGPLMASGKFDPAFPLKHMEKDLRLALELGEDLGPVMTTAKAARNLFAQALDRGDGDEDFCAVHRVTG